MKGITERNYKIKFPIKMADHSTPHFGDDIQAPSPFEEGKNLKYKEGNKIMWRDKQWSIKTAGEHTLLLERGDEVEVAEIGKNGRIKNG